ncbi:MAG: hypothetical protein JWN07_3081 [Hyphomicrobiales bacterium]|nr:hypothetical protein [Hyphomicrobiales bacterium]
METAVTWINHWAKKKPGKTALVLNGSPYAYEYLAMVIEATRKFLEQKLPDLTSTPDNRATAIIAIEPLLDAWVSVLAARSLGMDTLCVARVESFLVDRFANVACIVINESIVRTLRLSEGFAHKDKILILPDAIYHPAALRTIKQVRPPVAEPGGNFLASSGTTGQPKLVLLPASIEGKIADVYAKHGLLNASSRSFLMDYNLAAFGGYVYGLSSFKLGSTIIVNQGRDFLPTFYAGEFDYVTLRPSHIDRLYDGARLFPPVAMPKLRLHIGGGFINYRKIEWVTKNITPNLFHIYGATENSAFAKTKITCADDLLWHSIYPHRRVDIVDENDEPVPDGVEGKLRVRDEDYTAHEYFNDPESTAAHFHHGCFYTGDMAVRRADGRVRILGRVSDVLFIKSDRFAVGPIEEKIQEVAGCLDACVFARQNANTLSEILIALETEDTLEAAKSAELKKMFAMVDAVHITTFPTFPKTDGGKTDRSALRKLLFEKQDALA